MADPKPLTRNQIAAFVGNDPEAIRAIERLFRVAGELTPADIAALNVAIEANTLALGAAQDQAEVLAAIAAELGQRVIQADTATALAQSALAQLERIGNSLQGLMLAQPIVPLAGNELYQLPEPLMQALSLAELAPPIVPPKRQAYGSFYDLNTQTAALINTAYTISFSNTDLSFGVYLAGSPATRITVDQAGLYDFQHSVQIDKTTGGKGLFYLWYAKNGTDVSDSATRIRIEGNNSEQVGAWNYVFRLKAGDYIEYKWAVDDTGVEIKTFGASAPVPAVPSMIVTVTNNIGD